MRKVLLAFSFVAAFASQALADWTGKNAAGTTITFKNAGDCTSVVCVPIAQPVDSAGAAFGVTGNPFFVAPGTGQTFPVSAASASMVDLGAIADAAATTGSTGTLSAKLRLMTTQLNTINSSLATLFTNGEQIGSLVPGSAIIGKVGIDQTTPGTTNGVQVNASALPAGASTSALQASILTATPTLTTWAGSTLGAMANYGTSPGAVLVPGVNAFVTNTNANGQATAANSSPVVLPAAQVTADPCSLGAKINFSFGAATGTIQIVAPSGSTQVYICSIVTVGAAASVQSLVGGTGASCATGTPVAALGSTTAANGMSFAANGGMTFGSGGATAFRTTTAGHGMCIVQSGTVALAGGGTFVQQ